MLETDVALQLKGIYQKIIGIMQAKVDEYGLTFGLIHIALLIDKKPDLNQKNLAREMKLTEGAISSAVKRLLKLGMLKQIPLETDMRYNKLILTEKGKSIITDYKEHIRKKYEDIFKGFSEEELTALHDLLLKINRNLDDMNNQNL